MITEEQKKLRMQGLGASDAPIIAGYSSYKTPLELYYEKIGDIEPQDAGEAAEWGNLIEDAVAEAYHRRTGVKPRRSNQTIYHPQHVFIFSHLDRTISGGIPLEIKNTVKADEWGAEEEGPDGVPLAHNVQVQHQMACTGKERAVIAALFFGNRLRIYDIPRDEDLIGMLIDVENDFWLNHVSQRIPPEPDFSHRTTVDLLKRLHPGTNGKEIVLPEIIQSWHSVLQDAKGHIKRYSAIADNAKAHILDEMGDNATGRLPDGTAYTRKIVKRKAFGVDATEYVDFKHTKRLPKGE